MNIPPREKMHFLWGMIFLQIMTFTKLHASQISDKEKSSSYELKDDYPQQSLFSSTFYLTDDEQKYTIDQFLSSDFPGGFKNLDTGRISGKHTIWLYIKIEPSVDLTDWWLISKRPDGPLPFITRHDKVDAYFVQNEEVIKHAKSGTYVPASQKDISELITVNRFQVSFERGKPVEIYMRIYDRDIIQPILELRDPVLELPSAIDNTPYWGLVVVKHFYLIIGCYVFLFYFFTRDISYLYLLGMIVCLLLHYNILLPYMPFVKWLIPESPQLVALAWIIFTLGSKAFLFQFGRTYVDLKNIDPRLDKLVLYFVRIIVMIMVIRILIWLFNPEIDFIIENPIAILLFVASLIVVARLIFLKDILVKYFVLGASWMLIFSVYGVLWNMGIVDFFNFGNPWIISQGGFILIYALALARKIQISERAKSEIEKVKAIEVIKSQFFTNISHEFRTPLTLILGPINQSFESIPSSDIIDEHTEVPVKGKHLQVMKRNALRLENLINQILDLSRIDKGKLELSLEQGDVIKWIRSLVFSFESLAERNNIHYNAIFSESKPDAFFDRDKLEKIIVNLLSNAFKFTPEHGTVSVQVKADDKILKVYVSDTGAGMNPDEVDKVFDRFYSSESSESKGSGIGLALVKELVELHEGQVSVSSVKNRGTTFKVTLPYHKEDFPIDRIKIIPAGTNEVNGVHNFVDVFAKNGELKFDEDSLNHLPIALVVEDNPDLRDYIRESISDSFQIIEAKNGVDGVEKAFSRIPDIIISDIMMPRKNGFELCQQLKSDNRTSHIPIILLTAKTDQNHKIEGLVYGADDYLTKPFEVRELRVRMINLIEQRRNLRERYSKELRMQPTETRVSSMDERFLINVRKKIEEELSNEYFTVEELARSVGFSRSQLARKVKALTGKTSNHLIREFRLIRAKELLEQKSASISEIAYEVGYSNLSYFSKSYKEEFGILPSDT